MAEYMNSLTLLLVAGLAFGCGWLVAKNRGKDRAQKEEEQIKNSFTTIASQVLKDSSDDFVRLATENLKQFQVSALSNLDHKEKSIEKTLLPIKAALEKTEAQIREIEKERKESFGSISNQLASLIKSEQALRDETGNLVRALKRPEIRGQWGEITLKRLVELAGMVNYCDFYEQENTSTEDGNIRPDMIIRMPEQREIIVDVKTPLDAYLDAINEQDEKKCQLALKRHAKNMRERIRELASKTYWAQFSNSPDFIIMFIPGDQFLSAALDVDPSILEDALSKKVIPATPTSFIALLRAVEFGWRQNTIAENAEIIRKHGEELYQRLAVFSNHFSELGKKLDQTSSTYNKVVASFNSQLSPSAKRFSELGIKTEKEVSYPEPLEGDLKKIREDI